MRTHSEIVKDFGALRLSRELSGEGVQVNQTTPQRWRDRNSIPAEYWPALVTLGASTLDELATAAASRKQQDAA